MTLRDEKENQMPEDNHNFLADLGVDGVKWNEAYWDIWPEGCPDKDAMFGWFCNAIMAGYDEGYRRASKAAQENNQ